MATADDGVLPELHFLAQIPEDPFPTQPYRHVPHTKQTSLLALAIALAACTDSAPSEDPRGEWRSETEQRGDTTLVRTLGGSVWGDTMVLVPEVAFGVFEGEAPYIFGSIQGLEVDDEGRFLVVDAQAKELRIFSPEGTHLRTVGRDGEGPGEFRNPDRVQVASDGRIVVRNHPYRFAVFSPEGDFLRQWQFASTFGTNGPYFLDTQDHLLNRTFPDRLIRYDLQGTPLDTLPIPTRGYEPEEVTVRTETGSSTFPVPLSPSEQWTVTSSGAIAFGLNDSYSIDLTDSEGEVLRIERVVEPVPVADGERQQRQEILTRQVRRNAPDWSLQGAEVPTTKPAFRSLTAGDDGRLWVFRYTRGVEEPNPDHNTNHPGSYPTRWREPVMADVFDAEGRYLGPVKFPEEVGLRGVLTADAVVAVRTDPDGYPQVVRYRLERSEAARN